MTVNGEKKNAAVLRHQKEYIRNYEILRGNYKKTITEKIQNSHKYIKIGICRSGSGRIITREESVNYQSGMYFILLPDISMAVAAETDTVFEYVLVDENAVTDFLYTENRELFTRMLKESQKHVLVFSYLDKPQISLEIRLLMAELSDQKPMYLENSLVVLLSLVVYIVRDYYGVIEGPESKNRMDGFDFILPSLQYIQDHYHETVRVSQLAKECHVSETYYRSAFNYYMHMAPLDYINRFRIEKACELLLNSDYSVELISVKVGFRSMATFYRNFKNVKGCTPYQYRNTNQ